MAKSSSTDTARRAISSYMPRLHREVTTQDAPRVRDFMDGGCVKLSADMPIYAAIEVLVDRNVTGAVVIDTEDRLVGLLSEKDCLATLLRGAYDGLPGGVVRDYMAHEVETVAPDEDLSSVVTRFLRNIYHRLPVVEGGRVIGQITRRDVLRGIHRSMSERRGPVV